MYKQGMLEIKLLNILTIIYLWRCQFKANIAQRHFEKQHGLILTNQPAHACVHVFACMHT